MTTDELTTKVEAANDPAKQLGNVETWAGERVHVLRDAMGRFVTWRPAAPVETADAPVALADGGQDEITFTTDRGSEVTVTADTGTLFVSVESSAITISRTSAFVETHKGTDVLNLGAHRVQGTRQTIQIPVEGRQEEIEQLAEDSKTDAPLVYEVEEYTETSRAGGWGKREITKQRLSPNKSFSEMTDREQSLSHQVKTDRVPDDAEPGDVLTLEDLLDDPRTREERDQDALDEAAETGEEVVISETTTDCNDASRECSLDHVTRVATPGGEIETRRTHTY